MENFIFLFSDITIVIAFSIPIDHTSLIECEENNFVTYTITFWGFKCVN